MPPGSLLEKVVEEAKRQDPDGTLKPLSRPKAQERLQEITAITAGALPLEDPSVSRLHQTEKRLEWLAKKAKGVILRFPISVLRWRDAHGLPKLVTFDSGRPMFVINEKGPFFAAERDDSGRYLRVRSVPDVVREAYSDVPATLKKMKGRTPWIVFWALLAIGLGVVAAGAWFWSNNGSDLGSWIALWMICGVVIVALSADAARHRVEDSIVVEVSAQYEGFIPKDARGIINQAQSVFDTILILAEAECVVNRTVVPRRDPLIIGVDGDDLWILGAYDTKPLEELGLRVALGDTES